MNKTIKRKKPCIVVVCFIFVYFDYGSAGSSGDIAVVL